LLERRDPAVERGVPDAHQRGQLLMRPHDLLAQADLQAVDSREPFRDEPDVCAKALRDDVEVTAGLDGRCIDVLPKVGQIQLESVEALIDSIEALIDVDEALLNFGETPVDLVEALVDLLKPPVDLLKPPVDLLKPPVDLLKPPVDLLKPPVDVLEALIDVLESTMNLLEPEVHVLAQSRERRPGLGVHRVILLQCSPQR
jgi:hypothetical protein